MMKKNQTTPSARRGLPDCGGNVRKAGSVSNAASARWFRTAMAGLLMTGLAVTAQALPPEHEVQRLMLAVKDAVSAERWNEAADYLNRLQRIEEAKPADYHFFRGQVMAQSGHYNEARSALETYIA